MLSNRETYIAMLELAGIVLSFFQYGQIQTIIYLKTNYHCLLHEICLEQFGHEIVYLLFNTEKT